MKIAPAPLEGLLVIEPRVFGDQRGYFFETYQEQHYAQNGMPKYVQSNVSRSTRYTLRGLHYQLPRAQAKLVSVIRGAVFDVMVDIRVSSPTFGKWFGLVLSDENHQQVFIPPGFAHGFCVLSEEADFFYQCSDFYAPDCEHGIIWNDADLNIAWPVQKPVLSSKDEIYPRLNEIPREQLFA